MDYLNEFFGAVYDRKKADPQDDLTSALATVVAEDGSQLSREEVVNVIVAMFGAGFETTAHLIGNGVYAMHREPGQWATLVANPEEIAPRAVEEVLRFESSLQGTYRTALQPATVAGRRVEPGERILCLLGAANRDPAVFERAEVMDVTRKDSRMLSFGGGIHHCIGQQLARLEGRIAFATLARRLPQLQVAIADAQWRAGFLFRGLTEAALIGIPRQRVDAHAARVIVALQRLQRSLLSALQKCADAVAKTIRTAEQCLLSILIRDRRIETRCRDAHLQALLGQRKPQRISCQQTGHEFLRGGLQRVRFENSRDETEAGRPRRRRGMHRSSAILSPRTFPRPAATGSSCRRRNR